jgi:hypothetical protein
VEQLPIGEKANTGAKRQAAGVESTQSTRPLLRGLEAEKVQESQQEGRVRGRLAPLGGGGAGAAREDGELKVLAEGDGVGGGKLVPGQKG